MLGECAGKESGRGRKRDGDGAEAKSLVYHHGQHKRAKGTTPNTANDTSLKIHSDILRYVTHTQRHTFTHREIVGLSKKT